MKNALLQGVTATLALALLAGCRSSTPPSPTSKPTTKETTFEYPQRPKIAPPTFKVFHQDGSTFTLVTKENASDDEIASLIYELRDAAHTQSFDKLHISKKAVDARDPVALFHIYRGPKCAPESYVPKPPCGASHHAVGDYAFGGSKRKDWDDGILDHGENETHLWDTEAPYQPTH